VSKAATKPKANDLLSLTAVLRSRQPKMLTGEKLRRTVDSGLLDDAARVAAEIGYPTITEVKTDTIEASIGSHLREMYDEIARCEAALPVLDIFRAKYDIHNVKVLVKSMGANTDSSRLFSSCGAVDTGELNEAFITGDRESLPQYVKTAISVGVGTLSRTGNPNFADTAIDRCYFEEIVSLGEKSGCELAKKYVKLLIDCANLRVFVRSVRVARAPGLLASSLFDGGYVPAPSVASLEPDGAGIAELYKSIPKLREVASLAVASLRGGSVTAFERECDNAVFRLAADVKYVAFGQEVILEYLLTLDWEMMSLRMMLGGLYARIEPAVIAERLRENV
jgi:V/A-type H+-transporting ATPase subunit C